jgi:oligopeptide transport system permease protein
MAEAQVLQQPDELLTGVSSRQRGLWSDAFRRLIRNRLSMIALIVLAAVIILALLGNYVDAIQRYEPSDQLYDVRRSDPTWDHFFGTDSLGRDQWARVLEGTLISLQVGLGVAVVVLVIGLLIGGVAALGGNFLDNFMMRITDLAYAFPDLLFIILLRGALTSWDDVPIVGDPVVQLIIAISFVGWVTIARLVRGQMLSLKEQDFVLAARAMGASRTRIVFQHMLPNTLGPVIVAAVFVIPLAIFAEAVLSFIGFGIDPPTASLGGLVSDGYKEIRIQTFIVIFPATAIAILMLCFTFLGDGLRDALDPRGH